MTERGEQRIRWITRLLAVLATLLLAPTAAQADPADISAAARGVVRVVIVERDGDQIVPISHGTGFAVAPERIVTNAHVVAEAREDDDLAIAIVPSDGDNAVYGRVVAVNSRNDLALIATTSPMHLAPLTIAGTVSTGSGPVTAVGYPMNVDKAQGLDIGDLFRAQPPVTSTGFLSGRRPTREFDSLLHTAPIARGNSGGPLLDDCGRVIGVNSFGAESGGADAEFFFAVSTRELLPFLRTNGITPQINGMPCRSIAELDAQERERAERAQLVAQQRADADAETNARRRDEARQEIEFAVLAERENGMAIAMLLLMAAFGAGGFAMVFHERDERRRMQLAAGLAALAVAGAAVAWLTRPGFGDVDGRLDARLKAGTAPASEGGPAGAASGGRMICVLDPERSRVTGAAPEDVPLEWSPDGCVNGRTQYGTAEGAWSRLFVPDDEASVTINRFDPASNEYRIERFLLDHATMTKIRAARGEFQAPACGAGPDAARELGAQEAALRALLPEGPNERLVYTCSPAS
jgi:hypothetical protein